ncbi:hypothetical protein SARC_02317 [Sphaeroforma arctica JP610]|uniref:Uncharacterized protein n=1 Tax=Sphaeroforma arctica JP610 TaxID=667725 RepID=A0A0L0G9F2_9EUKA|nr:hypothetical protein SARC_02317 [Sphaeroforma arctica JP610]KNC85516.1 hypothetical protein SARC_02317 [Sphaeroforma arctica JP610]|eukprot:XP_014159418.1 hypothetical protein SARC_02317 [Sphaeroforma arctica JP610]
MQGDRMLREQLRVQNKRQNAQTTIQDENSTTTANKRYKPDNGAPNQNKPVGQAQEKRGAREEHRFSKCPKKKGNQAKQAEERAKKDVQ